jgi:hypothetical protein
MARETTILNSKIYSTTKRRLKNAAEQHDVTLSEYVRELLSFVLVNNIHKDYVLHKKLKRTAKKT